MPAKVSKDENPDLEKQIGCISGFFQLFDRHRFLTGQRTGSLSQNRPASGGSSNQIKELNGTMQKATAKNLKVASEKQQFSTESSVTSMSSSSCSSSMSSLEFNRTIQIEPSSISQVKFQEISSSVAAMKQLDTINQQDLDLHDIVKDLMNREAQGLSVKTVVKEGKKGHALKYIDSPRPLQAPKSVNTRVIVANEPFHVHTKSQKTHWATPRLSYDGRDMQDSSKSAMKHKELPRLSLDSREGSIRSFNEGTKPRNFIKGPQKGNGSSSIILNQPQEPETSRRPSSVVAKLMGLETFPDWTQTNETLIGTSSCPTNKREPLARLNTSDEYKQHRSSGSLRICKESPLQQSRQAGSTITGTLFSRFSLEPTPWGRPDASQSSQSPASKGGENSIKTSNPSFSVYGEIEKRLAELEFKKSGKDLRALKQILEAMQRYKDSLGITRDQASNSPSGSRYNSSLNEGSTIQSPRSRQKDTISVKIERSNSPQGGKLPIVIMKPTKATRKSDLSQFLPGNPTNGRLINSQTGKSINPTTKNLKDPFSQPLRSSDKSNKLRTLKLMQSSKVSQDIRGENTTSSGNITGTESPRLQQRSFGLERRSPPSSPSSDSSSNRRQQKSHHSIESSSPCPTPRQNCSTLQERNECFSMASCHMKDSMHHAGAISPDFNRKKSVATDSDTEVPRIDRSEKINSTSFQRHGLNHNNAAKELSKERSQAETTVTAEQPSPISVLDAAFYREDPPSPVKKKSDISKYLGAKRFISKLDEALNTNVDREENSAFLSDFSNAKKAHFSKGIGDRDLNARHLIQLLQIDSTQEEPINFNRPICDSKNLDHKYISEILLASGLLCGTSSSQMFHSPGHLINPKLFLALEQIKTNKWLDSIEDSAEKITETNSPAQMQRKLIFDVVNDILVQKLVQENTSSQWFMVNKVAGRKLRGQQLLYELCSEIDHLQQNNRNARLADEDEELTILLWEDLMHHPTIRTECCSEIPDIVLDIERLIFKDLITEVVRSEAANHLGSHCRQQLFSK